MYLFIDTNPRVVSDWASIHPSRIQRTVFELNQVWDEVVRLVGLGLARSGRRRRSIAAMRVGQGLITFNLINR